MVYLTPLIFGTVSGNVEVHTVHLFVCTARPLSVRKCVYVYHFLFLQRRLDYVSTHHELISCWYDETVFSLSLNKEHVEDGKERDNLGLGECNPSFFSRC